MATRTVRLDEEAERALQEVRDATGLPISEALKRGLRVLKAELEATAARAPYEIYREIDLGAGGYALGPARRAKATVRESIRKKFRP